MPDPSSNVLELEGIEKSFFGVPVLKSVSLQLAAGRTLGLVGENGAGKSTLMNILGGNLKPEQGSMRVFGEPYRPSSPRHAGERGIAFIHQELNLFSNLSIAENLFIDRLPKTASWLPFIRRRQMHRETEHWLKVADLNHSPGTPVEELSAGEQQLVEIAKALSSEARIVILDEPTTSLTSRETERLFDIMRRLRERGIAMIYISHNLNHVLEQCDDILVLRDGEVVGSGPRDAFTVDKMVSLMVGRSIEQFFPERDTSPGEEVVFEAQQVTQPGMVHGISFQLHRGEVLGISGLMGSGRSELARILFGLDPFQSGRILLEGQSIGNDSPRRRIEKGLAFLTENRREEGLCMNASIGDNITLASLSSFSCTPVRWVRRQAEQSSIDEMRSAVRLTATAGTGQAVKTLSGGNQQKVVLARWLLNRPRVFILDEPTRGIDVGAKYEVYTLINQLAASGTGILIISSEIEELVGMCDRILVMSRGEITDTIATGEFDRERILKSAIHHTGDNRFGQD